MDGAHVCAYEVSPPFDTAGVTKQHLLESSIREQTTRRSRRE